MDLDHAEEMELLLDNYYMQVTFTLLNINCLSVPLNSRYVLNKVILKIFFTATRQTEELGNKAGELKRLIDDSESVISINLDRWVCSQAILIPIFCFPFINVNII